MKNFIKMPYRKYINTTFFLIPFLLLTACKSKAPHNNRQGKNIAFEVIITNSHSNIEEPKNLIVETQGTLQELFNTINSTRKPGIQVPKVDFQKEMVAFINTGETSTGGHSVAVKEIVETKDSVVIYYEGKSPKAGENATMVITTPFTLVKFSKQSKPIDFEWI